MGDIDGYDVAYDYRAYGDYPRELGAYHGGVYAVACAAEDVPAEAEGVGCEWDDELPLHQQQRQEVRHVVCEGDGYEGEYIGAGDFGEGCLLAGESANGEAEEQVDAEEEQGYEHYAACVDDADAAGSEQAQPKGLDGEPVCGFLQAVEGYGGEGEDDEGAGLPRYPAD